MTITVPMFYSAFVVGLLAVLGALVVYRVAARALELVIPL